MSARIKEAIERLETILHSTPFVDNEDFNTVKKEYNKISEKREKEINEWPWWKKKSESTPKTLNKLRKKII